MAQPHWERLFKSTDSVAGASPFIDVGARTFHTFVLTPVTTVSNVEIQGNMSRQIVEAATSSDAQWHPVRYWEYNLATGQITGPHLGPITGQRAVRVFYVIDPWRHLRVYRSGGGSFVLDYWGQEKDGGWLTALGIRGQSTELIQADPNRAHISAYLKLGLNDINGLNRLPVDAGLQSILTDIWTLLEVPFVTPMLEIVGSDDGVAYSAGDAFGTGVGIPLPPSGVITEVEIRDFADQGHALALAFFASPLATKPVTNVAFAPTDSDIRNSYKGHINISAADFEDWSANRGGTSFIPAKAFEGVAGALMGYFIARSTPTVAAGNAPLFRLKGRTIHKNWTAQQ